MKHLLFTASLLLLNLLCAPALPAKEYTPEEVPMVHLQNKTRYVSNPDHILSDRAVAVMDTTLYALEQQTGIQVLAVVVERIAGGDCFEFAYQLGRSNGVGQKGKDNGLVILLVTGERCIQFATGYGLEGVLPDALCKRIQERHMNPFFAKDNWDEGMVAGIRAVRQVLANEEGTPTPIEENSDNAPLLIALLLCFIGVPALMWFTIRQRRKCPKCRQYKLRQISSRTVSRIGTTRTVETVYRCAHCGYVHRVVERKDDNDIGHRGGNGGPFMGGPFIGGFGGGHGGGGFSGGSFGGGDFGGGGAGSKF